MPEQRSAAEILLRQMAACGIDFLFGNGGTDFPPIVEAYARAEGSDDKLPKPLLVTHENCAVAMAHGAYAVSGRPQAVMVHVNVGTANTLNALWDAARDQVPLLLLAGRTPYSERGRHGSRNRYIHWAQEMFDQAGMLREAVKWDGELHLPEQASELVTRAMQLAMASPRGPVYATLPRDTLAAPAGSARVLHAGHATPTAPHPDPAALAKLAGWIAAAEQPLIITGAAGRSQASFDALAALAERFAIPVVCFNQRNLCLATDHPMHAGFQPGIWLKQADLVLVVDTDVPWIPDSESPPPSARVVHIGEDPLFARYPMRNFRADLAIAADTAATLQGLQVALEAVAPDAARIGARAIRAGQRIAAQRASAATAPPTGAITPEWISRCIDAAVGQDAIIVNEYPLRPEHCARTRHGTYFGLSPAGGLGWGFGAALGAKLVAPDRLVVATLGDGAYVFANPTACHWVAQAHALPVLVVVFNNRTYGAVRNATLGMYGQGAAAQQGARLMAELGPSPDYEKLAEASGGHGERVEAAADLPAALRRAVAAVQAGRQALVNVICDY